MKKTGTFTVPAFLGRNAHWFFIAMATAFMAGRFIPSVYLSLLDADNIQIPLLYQDLFEKGHHLHDWNWGGHSDLFPDVLIGFAVQRLAGDGLLSLQIEGSLLFAMLAGILVILYLQNGGRRVEIFVPVLFLFFVGLANNFGIHHGVNFAEIFTNNIHAGTQIMALVCLTLAQRVSIGKGYGKSFWLLFAVSALTTASDILFLAVFTVPFVITLAVLRLLSPAGIKLSVPLAGNLVAATALGHFIAKRIFPACMPPPVLHITGARALDSLSAFYKILPPSTGGHFVIFLSLDVALVVFAAYRACTLLRQDRAKKMPVMPSMLILFCAIMILCNWGAALLTGSYAGISSTRYVRLSLLSPVFLILGCLASSLSLPGNISRLASAILALAVSVCAFVLRPAPGSYYREAQEILPILRSTMHSEGIEAGLADYWYANVLTFLSHDTIKVRSITPDGSLYFWVNNITWFTGDIPSRPEPEFRMIFMANLDPEKIRRCYGKPSNIIPTPNHANIWVYPTDKKITFSRLAGGLSNKPAYEVPNQYNVPASSLPSKTGKPEGGSIVAMEGRDREDYLSFGPYIHPVPGFYRVRIGYTYITKPAAGKLVGCDFVLWTSVGREIPMGGADIPFVDTSHREFTRDLYISNKTQGAFEARTFYRGSGSIRLESLNITYLKP